MSRVRQLSPRCLVDMVPFTGIMGFVYRLRGITRSEKNPNLCTI